MTDKKNKADLGAFVIHQEGDVFGYFVPGVGGGGATSLEEAIELAEDLVDMQAVTEFKTNPKTGIPSQFVERMLAGDSTQSLKKLAAALDIQVDDLL